MTAVVKYSVEHYADAHFMRFVYQFDNILVCTEIRIDLPIIECIVFMV